MSTLKITPQKELITAIMATALITIKVGYYSTTPVCIKLFIIGIKKHRQTKIIIALILEKKAKGFVSLNRPKIVRITRSPSV